MPKPAKHEVVKLVDENDQLVHYSFIPPLRDPPDALQWGQRIFVRLDGEEETYKGRDGKDYSCPVYQEAFAMQVQYLSPEPDPA